MSFKDDVAKSDELHRQVRNLKARIRSRRKKLEKIFDPLERGRLEDQIKNLRLEQRKLEFEEFELNTAWLERFCSFTGSPDEPDWNKAGKA